MQTKITDLNADCIENILELLSFADLLNVAQSNKILNSSACTVVSRRYLKTETELYLAESQFCCNHPLGFRITRYLSRTDFSPLNFRMALRILRYFGRIFSKIVVNYYNLSLTQRQLIEHSLGENCGKNKNSALVRIVLENCPEDALRWIETPMENVKDVTICLESNLDFEQLNNKLPHMEILKLAWLEISDGSCIEQTFSALKHLEVEVRDREKHFTENNVRNAVLLNPQLTHVTVKLHPHPQLNPAALIDFLENNFRKPEKTADVILL